MIIYLSPNNVLLVMTSVHFLIFMLTQHYLHHCHLHMCSQMKSPGITTCTDGKNRTLYMQTVKSIEERTRCNLRKTLKGKLIFNCRKLWISLLLRVLNKCSNSEFWRQKQIFLLVYHFNQVQMSTSVCTFNELIES